jgi:ribonuclease VapC
MSPAAPRSVLDASALLAFMQKESGWESVGRAIGRSAVSAVNWSEVVGKVVARGVSLEGLRANVEAAVIRILDFSADDAELCGQLLPQTRALGLSLGDRAALALARRLDVPVYTSDRAWGRLSLGVRIRVVR